MKKYLYIIALLLTFVGFSASAQIQRVPSGQSISRLDSSFMFAIVQRLQATIAEASWNGWDGSNDGEVTNFFVDGGFGPANVAGFSSTSAIIVTNEQTADDLHGLIVTRSGTSLTGGTVTKISEGAETVGQKAAVGYMTASRVLTAYETNSSANRKVALIDVSGANPSALDYAVNGNTGASTAPNAIYRHTDTLGVWISEAGTSGSGHTIQTVDITGDSITLGTQLVMTNGATEAVGTALTATTGMILDNTGINHYTISGASAPTINGTILAMSPTAASFSDRSISRISDTRAVVIYKDSTNSKIYAQVITWNGTALIRGNHLEIRSDDNAQVQDNAWSTNVDADNGMVFVTWQTTSVDTKAVASILRIRDNATLELLADEVSTFSAIQADHPSSGAFIGGNNVYAITVAQNETTIPIKQVATKVIQGTGTGNELPTVGTTWVADVSTLSETGQRLDTNPPMTAGQGVHVHPEGTKMWQCGSNPDEVQEYTLSTAWDVTTAGSATQFDLTGTDNCFGVFWSSDGTTMWTIIDGGTQYIQSYSCTAYTVSTCVDDSANYTMSEDSNPKSFWVDEDDDYWYMLGQTNDTVYEYRMATPGTMSTSSYQTKSYNHGGTEATAYGLAFNVAKSRMYISGGVNVHEFEVVTPGDIGGTINFVSSSATYIVGSSRLGGMYIRQDDGSQVWFTNPNTDFIHTFGMIAENP